jgi:hypothetical protein
MGEHQSGAEKLHEAISFLQSVTSRHAVANLSNTTRCGFSRADDYGTVAEQTPLIMCQACDMDAPLRDDTR